ncbi:branched-chain amino acid ABC transporter substrate-binding protein [Roseiterribacter gracilis]|uniref:Branched chain amino acid ABC transporter substrate-binding protein n=1 Tax=Roseiterribacter gracilis TaxID=2812848 RepID=A0A8S8XAP6_9PROT|nr:branched chain amino acid ABC transporter substrate-binding protein [Rhodospirillales bacterium TMPK1]
MKRLLVGAIVASVLTLTSCDKKEDAIEIGFAGPITGFNAVFGAQMKRGAEQAVADINAAGGVLGKKLVMRMSDDVCDPKQAVAVANQMAAAKIPFVLGHFCSGSSIPASDVYAEANVIAMSPGSTNPKLTDDPKKKTIFRICGRDDAQGRVAGAWLAKKYAGKRIAIAHDRQAYSQGIADETKKAMNAAGLQEVLYDTVTPGEKDYSAFVSKLKAARIDLLYYGGYQIESSLIARQMREQGLEAAFMAGDGLGTMEFWTAAGAGGEGTLFTFGPDLAADPRNAEIVKRFTANGGNPPEGYTLYSYAGIQAWAQAVQKAGTTDPTTVAAMLRSNKADTVFGPVTFDAKGDVIGEPYVMYRWSKGAYAPLVE